MVIILMAIGGFLLMVIDGYFLMVVNGYCIISYYWLLYVILQL